MRLEFLYLPVEDVGAALALYRDHLGFAEAWREGELTVALELPGTDVRLIIDQEVEGDPPGAGPFFVVDSVDAFHAANRDALRFVVAPKDISPGRYAAFLDPSGNVVRVMDRRKGG